ncbi:flagellar hook-basal body complex protein [Acetobacterium tundrae]|uniref:Flagellar hook protein FlgE n=1 Tax=Acetobacterium tundrae TaxID=132932 RepID=A0ABR6WKP8_9FIRM|nr:flagellar hook-basal body complex protein [Acetobacterium tundrae]MBC3797088.1 flagellar hook-basal body complex protein [Acetobacterium tundrae]
MIRSLYSGASGMQAHQTKLNVIGNNIANVNTYGFKSSRVVFSDVLYQNLSNANAASATSGGTNASQLGYGSKIGSIDVNNTISSGADTGRSLDVYINGEGYLAVQGAGGTTKYTRVGNLKFDAAGNLTDANGGKILGIPTDASGNPILNADGTLPVSDLKSINVDPAILDKCTGIAIGKSGEITVTQAGSPKFTKASGIDCVTGETVPATTNYSGKITLTVGLGFASDETVPGEVTSAGVNISTEAAANINGEMNLTYDSATSTYTLNGFQADGSTAITPVIGTRTGNSLSFTVGSGKVTIADVSKLTLDSTGATAYTLGTIDNSKTVGTVTVNDAGGTAHTGTYTPAVSPETTGTITFGTTAADKVTITIDQAKYDALVAKSTTATPVTLGTIEAGSSVPKSFGYIAIAKFANTDGLNQDGGGYSIQSENSGNAVASKAGTNETGQLISSELESSNVDLSKEFTEMIIAQRGFQACSRVITVSDTILEELINLKR